MSLHCTAKVEAYYHPSRPHILHDEPLLLLSPFQFPQVSAQWAAEFSSV